MTCDVCRVDYSLLRGAIVRGKYGQYCSPCIQGIKRPPNSGAAKYARDRDHDAHEFDLIQPWDIKGNPNREFISNYPTEAHDMFTKEELEQYG